MSKENVMKPRILIPPQLQERILVVPVWGKSPERAGKGWQHKGVEWDHPTIQHSVNVNGTNYGIQPGDSTCVIDVDDPHVYTLVPEHLKGTLTSITGRASGEGKHMFLDVYGAPKAGIIFKINPATGKSYGHINGPNCLKQTVGPGSIHPDSGMPYRWMDETAPVLHTTWPELLNAFIDIIEPPRMREERLDKVHGNVGSSTMVSELNLQIRDFAMPDKPVDKGDFEIQGGNPFPSHGSSTGMNFRINTQKQTWYCYRDEIGGDVVMWIWYAHCGGKEGEFMDGPKLQKVKQWLQMNGMALDIKRVRNRYLQKKALAQMDADGYVPVSPT